MRRKARPGSSCRGNYMVGWVVLGVRKTRAIGSTESRLNIILSSAGFQSWLLLNPVLSLGCLVGLAG